ncbi:hypothetical protein BDB01DRAFT_716824 [Pilobolus umbonatus]|nr:hypothetical protein BDB01DRAFT_716824 [Pilobolus umbonatus]
MSDNGEWQTVSNHKHHPPTTEVNKTRRRSKAAPLKKKPVAPVKDKKKSTPQHNTQQKGSNPFHSGDEEESEDDEDDGLPDPIDLPVPPYHTNIVVSCPFEGCESPMPFLDTTTLVKHLKESHKLAFKNLHHIYMALDAYLSRWAKELSTKNISKYAYLDPENKEVYVIDPEKCPLDKEIREKMQREKLNEMLNIQQREREVDSKRPRKCLFCKIVCENRAILFRHMFCEHNFNIGLPDNLVLVNEFLDTLESKLSSLQCLYCEKTFTSPAVLRKHMRKKKHFKIASKNRKYDRFYVINYLEPGKNWENFEHDNYDSDDDKRDESWADWEEDVDEPTMCLFDIEVLSSPKEAMEHMKTAHGFDLSQIRKEKDLDFYATIVLINYIRHQSSLNTCFSCGCTVKDLAELPAHLKSSHCISHFVPKDASFWKDPRYLLPTYENDPLLTGFEDDGENDADMNLSDSEANMKYMNEVMKRSLHISDEKM